ncbi:MAG: L-2-amino-thiazoline-4-carboxylic acid hydrolase [Candidatus Lokiarchaeota archaeon]|nr:L-2-amino-thiazoline-4-carboxylic acid hydrolase [Candidatus Lokiarchaeota archaeon]
MKKKGILKGGNRKEATWNQTKLGEPFKKALIRFRNDVLPRDDFDPTSLLQFGLFMSMAVINILKEAEKKLGKEGQEVIIDALIKTGYSMGNKILEDIQLPADISDMELISFLATIINTQAWTSIEDPRIDGEDQCSFDILWCPLQDVYKPFDCRVQRYLVQGIINAFRDSGVLNNEFQVEFKTTIPAGADTCLFEITKKKQNESDKWEEYSKILEKKALKK